MDVPDSNGSVGIASFKTLHNRKKCTGFGSCFSHFTSETTNDMILFIKSYKRNKEKKGI